jgi:hypothetical protein
LQKKLLKNTDLNYQEYLFLAALEKGLTYLADEIYRKIEGKHSQSMNDLSLSAKWDLLSKNIAIKNLIQQEININGVLSQINLYESSLMLPKNDNLISTDNTISLKKLNELLDKTYKWSDLLRKTLDEC